MAVINRIFEAPRYRPNLSLRLELRPILYVTGAAVVVLALLQVVQTSDVATTSFAMRRQERERLELQTRVRQMEAEVASLSSLGRVQQEAQARLGLVPPGERRSLRVNAPAPAPEELLPTRFAPTRVAEGDGGGSPWWRDALKLLPFY